MLEFYSPRTKQRDSDTISVTKSPWDGYNKREIIERHEVNYQIISNGLKADGYIRTAVSKYENSIFLRGYKIHTLKPAIDKYLLTRLQLIVDAMPSHNHIDDFFQAIAHDLVAYANVFIIKHRRKQTMLPNGLKLKGVPRVKPGGKDDAQPKLEQRDPIVCYELVHPATMHIVRDKNGNVVRYEQWPMGAVERPNDTKNIEKWQPGEIIHIVVNREDGYAYGTPFLTAVIEDIRMLRGIEDHVSRLTYRFAFPFTQVKVGLDKPGMQATEEDLTYYRNLVSNAPPDATLTTSEKVSFEVIGVEGQALEMGPYLTHFKGRAFSGLGVSSVAMGDSADSSRATADAMSTEMHDQIKHFQNVFARNVNQEILRELLLEGGFDWYADPIKNWAMIIFEEIEVESQIKRESHYLSLLQANAITFEEFRKLTGRQPFTDKDWEDGYLVRFLLPQDIVKISGIMDLDEHGKLMLEKHKLAMDTGKAQNDLTKAEIDQVKADTEATKNEAPATAGAHQTVTTGQTVHQIPGGGKKVSTTKTVKTPVKTPAGHLPGPTAAPKTTAKGNDNKNRPANQHGKRLGPKRSTEGKLMVGKRDLSTSAMRFLGELETIYGELQEAAIEQATAQRLTGFDRTGMVRSLFALTQERLASLSGRYLLPAFHHGLGQFIQESNLTLADPWINERAALVEFNERTVTRLINDLSRSVGRVLERPDYVAAINDTFERHRYRLTLIARTELPQAYWFGYASGASVTNTEVVFDREADCCEVCTAGEFSNSSSARRRLAAAPTLHPQCLCGLKIPEAQPDALPTAA